ncbi:MAG TPA: hemolysin family protein [Thermodesulfovibrionales bacterium]|nr:hemolysin family protein [Thermodesulfovibrionales bacterium]
MWPDILLIIIFILLNGLFAAAEIAVVTLRRTRVKQLIDEGNKRAVVLDKFRKQPHRFLATIQLGITLAGVLASAIGGAAAVEIIKPMLKNVPIPLISVSSEAIAIGLISVIITYFFIVFGELIPKSIALSHPESTGLLIAPFIEKFSKLVMPFVQILRGSTNLLLKPFGKRAFSERGYISEEEIKLLLEEGRERGIFEAEEKELIHSVFEFTDMSVKEVMVPSPQMVTISLGMSMEDIKTTIAEEQFSRYPAVGKDLNDIRGILYAKDFLNTLARGGADIRKLIKPPFFIPETMKISNLLREMQRKRVHMALVIDEYGGVSGLVTMEDLLEEIVGEIRDEYDVESPVIQLGDGTYRIDASISIRDLKEDYEIEIPESTEYETLSGFLLTALQRIPKTGDVVKTDGKNITILEMVGQRISKVKLEKAPEEAVQQ